MDEGDSIGFLLSSLSAAPEAGQPLLPTSVGPWWVSLLILFILIFINGFFSAAEFSVVSSSHNKVKRMAEEGDKVAIKLLKLLENPSGFLATIQVGVTFAGFLSSAFASDQFAHSLALLLDPLQRYSWSRTLSVVIITVLLSYFSLVLGELVPKRLALQNPEAMSRRIAGVVRVCSFLLWPFTKLLTVSTNLILRLFGIDPNLNEQVVTEEEIRMMLDVSNEKGNIQMEEKEMINNIFEFNDKEVSEIMTHRTNVVALPRDASYEETVKICCEEKFSRIPVYEDNIDDIIGILHIKDMLQLMSRSGSADHSRFDITSLMRQPYVTPETKSVDALFREMQRDRVQLAVVIDEYGGTAGIVTIEDILEEIVGNILDEYDEENAEIIKNPDGSYTVDGLASPEDVADQVEGFLEPEDDDAFDTMGGYVVHLLDRIPDEEEHPEVRAGNYLLRVEEMDEKRISKLRLIPLPAEEEVLTE